jgi:hypothetical protein
MAAARSRAAVLDGMLYSHMLPGMDQRDETLSPQERELAELYTALIESYEDQHYAVPRAPPEGFFGPW